MSKQFVKGNVYVFSKKAFLRAEGREDWEEYRKWVNHANGHEVEIWGEVDGCVLERLFVIPRWCKCIKNNVSSKR